MPFIFDDSVTIDDAQQAFEDRKSQAWKQTPQTFVTVEAGIVKTNRYADAAPPASEAIELERYTANSRGEIVRDHSSLDEAEKAQLAYEARKAAAWKNR